MGLVADSDYLVFIDEQQFSTKDKQSYAVDNALYYCCVFVPRLQVPEIRKKLQSILLKMKAETFHASQQYRPKRTNQQILKGIHDLLIEYQLLTYCFRYESDWKDKVNSNLSNIQPAEGEIDWSNLKHQGYFFLIQKLSEFCNQTFPNKTVGGFMDRGAYGIEETDDHYFGEEDSLRWLSHVNKELIDLIALPDYLAYLFRKYRDWNFADHHPEKPMKKRDEEIALLARDLLKEYASKGLFKFGSSEEWLKEFAKDE